MSPRGVRDDAVPGATRFTTSDVLITACCGTFLAVAEEAVFVAAEGVAEKGATRADPPPPMPIPKLVVPTDGITARGS